MYKENGSIQRVFNLKPNRGDVLFFLRSLPFVMQRTNDLLFKYWNLKEDIENVMILTSEPRSGSTWVHDVIIKNSTSLSIWEPFSPIFGVLPKRMRIGQRPYFIGSSFNGSYKKVIEGALTFGRFNFWTTSYTKLNFPNGKILNKLVRGNLLLPTLTKTYLFKYKPILLLRHPVPTVLSQLKGDKIKKECSGNFKAPKLYGNSILKDNEEYINSLPTELERGVAFWCIYNMPTLKKMNSLEWKIVFYEHILDNPEKEFIGIFENFGLPIPDKFIGIQQPSASVNVKFTQEFNHQKSKWLGKVSAKEQKSVQNVMDNFELKVYSAFECDPII